MGISWVFSMGPPPDFELQVRRKSRNFGTSDGQISLLGGMPSDCIHAGF